MLEDGHALVPELVVQAKECVLYDIFRDLKVRALLIVCIMGAAHMIDNPVIHSCPKGRAAISAL